MLRSIVTVALGLLAALGAGSGPVWAQALAPVVVRMQTEAEKPAAAPVKSAKPAKAHKVRKATLAKRQQDARHCLQEPSNDAIIRCAEEYL